MADIENPIVTEVAASNTAPSPDGLPASSSPNIVYTEGREVLAMCKRWWNRSNPTVTSAGSANAQTIAFGQAPTQGYVLGQSYAFIVGAGLTNTGPCTINVNGLGAKNIFLDGFPLQGGEIRAGLVVELVFDSVQFQIVSARPLASLSSTLGSMRNFLINPLFNVQQRGAQGAFSMGVAASTSPYTLDRWYLSVGANQTSAVVVNPAFGGSTGPSAVLVQRNAGQTGITGMQFAQTLDTDIIQLLAGQQVTVSAQVQALAGFTAPSVFLQLAAGTGAPTRSITGFTGATIPATVGPITVTPGGAGVTLSATGVIPSNTRQLEVRINWTPAGTAPANDCLVIYNARLNLGPVDLGPDLSRIYTTELPICQRFFQKSFPASVAPAQNAGTSGNLLVQLPAGATGTFAGSVLYPTRMRIAPAINTYNPSAANANWRDLSSSADRTVGAFLNSDSGFSLTGVAGVASTSNLIHWTADAEIL